MVNDALPRVLLVEDDPISASFLEAALTALPASVDVAANAAEAMCMAQAASHALWLIDANLPNAHGIELLARLRAQDGATPAWAHTADTDAAMQQRLLDAGFATVIIKPIAVQALHARLRQLPALQATSADRPACGVAEDAAPMSPSIDTDLPPLWDDATALRALGGEAAHVQALRGLFLQELAQQRQAVLDADVDARRELLHKLLASCGFVGAMRLRDGIVRLQAQPRDPQLLEAFALVAAQTLAAAAQAGMVAPD